MKKIIAVMLVLVSVLGLFGGALAAEKVKTKTMYVYTENGGTLNVRRDPIVKSNNAIGELQFGQKVTVLLIPMVNADWTAIKYSKGVDGVAYVMTRFLTSTKPDPDAKKKADDQARLRNLEELNRQISTHKPLDTSLALTVRTTRTSGWITFRMGPGIAAERITSFPDGHPLTAVGETKDWYEAMDAESGRVGYIHKNYVNVLGPVQEEAPATAEVNEKESLGKLTVNGEFALQCRLPEGYSLQVVNMKNTRVMASVLPADNTKPVMYLTIAYNEMYSGIERMNDMTDEQIKTIEDSFTETDDVEISYRETGYGTKLLVVKEKENGADYVDIFTVYKGYEIEFIMTPNPEGAQTTELTEDQIRMCVDFLTEMDFVEA